MIGETEKIDVTQHYSEEEIEAVKKWLSRHGIQYTVRRIKDNKQPWSIRTKLDWDEWGALTDWYMKKFRKEEMDAWNEKFKSGKW